MSTFCAGFHSCAVASPDANATAKSIVVARTLLLDMRFSSLFVPCGGILARKSARAGGAILHPSSLILHPYEFLPPRHRHAPLRRGHAVADPRARRVRAQPRQDGRLA